MKVLFLGLGSIGQRHLRNFISLQSNEDEILVLRKTDHNLVIQEGELKDMDLKEAYSYRQITSIEEVLKENVDIGFITNPTSLHLPSAIELAKNNCDLFIEKPLSHSLEDVHSFKKVVESNNIKVYLGFQTRFHPCYQFTQKIIQEKKYGKIKSANFHWGTYLPDHHPYEDFRNSYAARKDLGGGVILGLSHELDLIYGLWGQPLSISILDYDSASLGLEVEETVHTKMDFRINGENFSLNLFLSYAQKDEKRSYKINFEHGLLECDLINNQLVVYDKEKEIIDKLECEYLTRNDLFLEQMKNFLFYIEGKDEPVNSLHNGIEVLKLAMKIKNEINHENKR